jgi:hypothetical protein
MIIGGTLKKVASKGDLVVCAAPQSTVNIPKPLQSSRSAPLMNAARVESSRPLCEEFMVYPIIGAS